MIIKIKVKDTEEILIPDLIERDIDQTGYNVRCLNHNKQKWFKSFHIPNEAEFIF